VELDDEIVKILKKQVINATKFMPIGFLGKWEPEVDALLRFLIWKVCMSSILTADILGGICYNLMFSIYHISWLSEQICYSWLEAICFR